MTKKNIVLVISFIFLFSFYFTNSVIAAVGDTSRQTEKFKAPNKVKCYKKINKFISAVTPFSLGPDRSPGVPGECMRCREVTRKWKKPTPPAIPLPGIKKKKGKCEVVGECVVVEDRFCEGISGGH